MPTAEIRGDVSIRQDPAEIYLITRTQTTNKLFMIFSAKRKWKIGKDDKRKIWRKILKF